MSEKPLNIGEFETPQELINKTPTVAKTVETLDARLVLLKEAGRELVLDEPVKIAALDAAMDEVGLDLLEALLPPNSR